MVRALRWASLLCADQRRPGTPSPSIIPLPLPLPVPPLFDTPRLQFGPDAHKAIRAVLDKPPSNFLSDDWLDDEDDDPDDSESDEGGLAWPPNTAAAVEGPNSADDVQDASSPEPHEFPRVARLRMNLTVLSQQYDVRSVRPLRRVPPAAAAAADGANWSGSSTSSPTEMRSMYIDRAPAPRSSSTNPSSCCSRQPVPRAAKPAAISTAGNPTR